MENFVEVDGVRIHTRRDGDRERPLIVLVNSLMTDLGMWDETVGALLNMGFRTFRYDMMGHGESSYVEMKLDFDFLTHQLAKLIGNEPIQTLMGDSIGGIISLRFAYLYPNRVGKIISCSAPGLKTQPGTVSVWEDRIGQVKASGIPPLAAATVKRWFPVHLNKENKNRMQKMTEKTKPAAYIAFAHALQSYDYEDSAAKISKRPLLVAGSHDANLPSVIKALAESIPHSHFVEVQNAGHIPMVEQPNQYMELITPYLLERQ